MSDTAKKCPNCGYSNNKFRIDTVKPYILGGVIGLVGLFITILSFPVMSGWGGSIDPISSEFYVGCAMFLCGIIVMFIGCKKLRTYFNRSMLLFGGLVILCVVSLVIFFLSVGFHHWEPYIPDKQMEQTASEDNANISNSGNSIKGEYEFVDSDNNTWELILNEDNTVNLHVKNGRENYGTWNVWSTDNLIAISIPYDDAPRLNIKGDVSVKSYLYIRDGYIYHDLTASKAKNPRMRISITKTK